MKKLLIFLSLGIVMLFLFSNAHAVPVSIGGPVSGSGDGVNTRWVNTSYAPHNVDQALNALALGPGDAGYVSEVNQIATEIDFTDNYYNNGYIPGYTLDPMTPDQSFAVGYYGFINITSADTYSFNAFTDDGFRLEIGGEMISQHYGDRAPGSTQTSINLEAGLYEFMMVGWEQGGQFVNELSWHNSRTSAWSLVDSEVLFTSAPVPEPATMLLLGTGLVGLAGLGRKRFLKK